MRSTTLTCLLALGSCFSSQCSRPLPRDHAKVASPSGSEIQRPSVVKADDEASWRYYVMENEIRRSSEKLGIQYLKDSDNADEIRIWVGFGLTYPRCFTLRRVKGEREVSYLTLTTGPRRKDAGEVEARRIKTVMAIPKSGWDGFETFLRSQGIESPIRLGVETDYIPNPDGQIIAVEVKSGAAYSMVFFHIDNKSPDAKKALNVCRRIEEDFDIAMHCGVQ